MAGVDFVIQLEIAFILLIILLQVFQFRQNLSKIRTLSDLYPEIRPEIAVIPEADNLKLIGFSNNFSRSFQQLLEATNLYLQKNRGAAADFNILRDISERESDAIESEIDSSVALPLYIGLLGTFGGVIIGLIKIAFFEGITDASIQSFLGGVLIGMVGSACGLLFTTLGNYSFKQAKLQRDRLKNEYYTFLQAELLPSLTSDMAGSLTSLKDNLHAFNQEFSQNLDSFKGTISQITENVALQKEFLEKLHTIGYQQLAAANVEVFSRIEKSAPVFNQFVQSIHEANKLTEQAGQSFGVIRQIMDDLRGFRENIHGLGNYLKENDNLIDKQVKYLNAYIQTAAQTTDSMGKHFDRADDAISKFVERRIQTLMEDSRKAAVQMEAYFEKLREDNIHVSIAHQIDSLKTEIQQLNGSLPNGKSAYPPAAPQSVLPAPSSVVTASEPARKAPEAVPPASRRTDFVNSFVFKVFVYTSTAFYAVALGTLLMYIITAISRWFGN